MTMPYRDHGEFPPMRGRYRLIGTSPTLGKPVAIASRKTREGIEERRRWYGRLGYTDLYVIPPKGTTDERSTR